jgi:hypothetical protein
MILPAFALAAAVAAPMPHLLQPSQSADPVPVVHVVNTFRFELAAPFARVAPLFGPQGERAWAGKHWNPVFLYPLPARDTEGAVFTVQHGPHTSVWINTRYDLAAGRMQYVSLIPDVVVSVIGVRLSSIDAAHTAVEVTYTRTALEPAGNEVVEEMGAHDRTSGPVWQHSIEAALGLIASPAKKSP